MSLLMKALKKAEESQQGSHHEGEPTLRELADELSLEPTPEPAAAVRDALGAKAPGSAGAGQIDVANLFAAKEPHAAKRKRLVAVLGATAFLLLAAGGAYVYIAVNKPALLMSAHLPPSPPPSAAQPAPQVENQLPALPGSALAAVAQPGLIEAQPELFPRPSPARNSPLPAGVSAVPGAEPDSAIKVQRGGKSEINPDLAQAYQSLLEGRLETARALYQRLLQQEPRNVDALLGMAAVAARSNNMGEAGRLYFRALEVEPKNAFAQAGLLNLLGSSDPAGSEARLKQLLAERPAGFLHFALGNLYAALERWPEAQQAYFQAHHLESDNPDYAFNLAVSLEHIAQPKPALRYYQRALQLQRQRGADFERATAEARIAQLQKMTE